MERKEENGRQYQLFPEPQLPGPSSSAEATAGIQMAPLFPCNSLHKGNDVEQLPPEKSSETANNLDEDSTKMMNTRKERDLAISCASKMTPINIILSSSDEEMEIEDDSIQPREKGTKRTYARAQETLNAERNDSNSLTDQEENDSQKKSIKKHCHSSDDAGSSSMQNPFTMRSHYQYRLQSANKPSRTENNPQAPLPLTVHNRTDSNNSQTANNQFDQALPHNLSRHPTPALGMLPNQCTASQPTPATEPTHTFGYSVPNLQRISPPIPPPAHNVAPYSTSYYHAPMMTEITFIPPSYVIINGSSPQDRYYVYSFPSLSDQLYPVYQSYMLESVQVGYYQPTFSPYSYNNQANIIPTSSHHAHTTPPYHSPPIHRPPYSTPRRAPTSVRNLPTLAPRLSRASTSGQNSIQPIQRPPTPSPKQL